jgi:hypothetical protein
VIAKVGDIITLDASGSFDVGGDLLTPSSTISPEVGAARNSLTRPL